MLIIVSVDAVICALALSSDSEPWTTALVLEIVLYCTGLLIIFVAAFCLVPLAQLMLVAWFMNRNSKHGTNVLGDYIPKARANSTLLALIWCILSYTVAA